MEPRDAILQRLVEIEAELHQIRRWMRGGDGADRLLWDAADDVRLAGVVVQGQSDQVLALPRKRASRPS